MNTFYHDSDDDRSYFQPSDPAVCRDAATAEDETYLPDYVPDADAQMWEWFGLFLVVIVAMSLLAMGWVHWHPGVR